MAQTNQEINSSTNPKFIPEAKISYEDFLVEYYGQYVEYVDGEVIKPMSVTDRHDYLVRFLTTLLTFYAETKKLGRIHGEPYQMKMEIEGKIIGREPDLFFISKDNYKNIGRQFYDGGADLVIEVISPESIVGDTKDKFEEYEKAGVKEYWLIDYERRTANFYGLDSEKKYELLLPGTDKKFKSGVIEGLWINTDWLWQEELPNLIDILREWKLV